MKTILAKKLTAKILSGEDDFKRLSQERAELTLVFTNGCFDILHLGHLHLLSQAKDLGNLLIVGLNSDASVSRLKGQNRPVKDESTRCAVLASLEFVDYVALFEEDTPARLIENISPDILVKGGDYKVAEIVGADHVLSYNGSVTTIPFLEGNSSTVLIDKLKKG